MVPHPGQNIHYRVHWDGPGTRNHSGRPTGISAPTFGLRKPVSSSAGTFGIASPPPPLDPSPLATAYEIFSSLDSVDAKSWDATEILVIEPITFLAQILVDCGRNPSAVNRSVKRMIKITAKGSRHNMMIVVVMVV